MGASSGSTRDDQGSSEASIARDAAMQDSNIPAGDADFAAVLGNLRFSGDAAATGRLPESRAARPGSSGDDSRDNGSRSSSDGCKPCAAVLRVDSPQSGAALQLATVSTNHPSVAAMDSTQPIPDAAEIGEAVVQHRTSDPQTALTAPGSTSSGGDGSSAPNEGGCLQGPDMAHPATGEWENETGAGFADDDASCTIVSVSAQHDELLYAVRPSTSTSAAAKYPFAAAVSADIGPQAESAEMLEQQGAGPSTGSAMQAAVQDTLDHHLNNFSGDPAGDAPALPPPADVQMAFPAAAVLQPLGDNDAAGLASIEPRPASRLSAQQEDPLADAAVLAPEPAEQRQSAADSSQQRPEKVAQLAVKQPDSAAGQSGGHQGGPGYPALAKAQAELKRQLVDTRARLQGELQQAAKALKVGRCRFL